MEYPIGALPEIRSIVERSGSKVMLMNVHGYVSSQTSHSLDATLSESATGQNVSEK